MEKVALSQRERAGEKRTFDVGTSTQKFHFVFVKLQWDI